jgi:hypothetical protein
MISYCPGDVAKQLRLAFGEDNCYRRDPIASKLTRLIEILIQALN